MARPSRYNTVQIDLAGSTNLNRSRPVSIQTTKNLYPEVADPGGINRTVLHSWPDIAIRLTGTAGTTPTSGPPRGMTTFNGKMYAVTGSKLYEYTVNPAPTFVGNFLLETEIGTISQTNQRQCGFASNGETLVITNGSTPYSFDGTTLTALTGITFNPKTVQYLNDRFWFDGADGKFYASDVTSTNVDGANSAFPRSAPDDFVMPVVFDQIIYMFCTTTIEPWAPAATGLPPANRVNQGIIENIGILSPFGVATTPDAMFFISSRGMAYSLRSYVPTLISTPGVTSQFQNYDLSQISASTVNRYGQRFVVFQFLADGVTWAYSTSTNQWLQLSTTTGNELQPFEQGVYEHFYPTEIFNKTFTISNRTKTIGSFIEDTGTTSGLIPDRKIYERVLPVIAGETFGKAGKKLRMRKLRISMETGVGTGIYISGNNSGNPVLMVSFSTDGKSFGPEKQIKIGELGTNKVIEVFNNMEFRRLYIKLKIADQGSFHLYDVSIDLMEAGR